MNNVQQLEAWQNVPVKIILEAINHAKKQNEEDNLIAFLLLDIGAEMLFKTYLGLPKKVTGAITSEDERFVIIRKGFHDIVNGVKSSRQGINVRDLARVEFFHGIRNKLYHQGNGLTVNRSNLDEYVNVIKRLFNQLLKVDIDHHLSNKHLTREEVLHISGIQVRVNKELKKTKVLKKNLDSICELVVETVSPGLLLPSYTQKFLKLTEKAYYEDGFTMVGNEVISFKELPDSNDKRLEIVKGFDEITKFLISDTKYYDILYKRTEVLNKFQLNALTAPTLGIDVIKVKLKKVPSIFTVMFTSHFSLKSFYYNLVEILIFDDTYFNFELDSIMYEVEGMYPQSQDQTDLEYWESLLNTSEVQNKMLKKFTSEIDAWLCNEGKS